MTLAGAPGVGSNYFRVGSGGLGLCDELLARPGVALMADSRSIAGPSRERVAPPACAVPS